MLRTMSGNLARQVVVGLSQLTLMILIARLHGPEGVGTYTLTVLIPMLGAQVLTFGVQSASVYLGAQKKFSFGLILRANLLMALVISVLFLLVGVPLVITVGEDLFAGLPTGVLFLGLSAFPATFGITTLPALAQAANAFRAYNLFLLTQPVIQLALALCMVFAGGSVGALVLSFAFSSWAAFLTMSVWMTRNWGLGTGSVRAFFRAAIGYGMLSHLGNIATLLNYRTVVWLSASMLGFASSGIYVLAMQIAEKLWLPSQAAATVVFPRLAQLHGTGAREQSLAEVTQVARATLLVTAIPALACGLVASQLMMAFFGAEAKAAAAPFVILLTGIVAWAPSRILATDISARGAARVNLWTAVITLTVNLVLLLVLIPRYGIQGAALATTFAYVIDLVVRSLFHAWLSGTVPFFWLVPTQDDLAKLNALLIRKGSTK